MAQQRKGQNVSSGSDNPKVVSWRQTLRAIWQLGVPFFSDPKTRLMAWSTFILFVALVLLQTFAILRLTTLIRDFTNAMLSRKEEEFWDVTVKLIFFVMGLGPLFFVSRLLMGVLQLEWRRYLTHRMFDKYINASQSFYRLKMEDPGIDNPDQRIAQDVSEFTRAAMFLVDHFTRDISSIITNSWALYHISARLWYINMGFSVIYTLVMLKGFASPLMVVQRRILGLEADLRFVLMRLRENAESIAFFQGAHMESLRCDSKFVKVIKAAYKKLFIESGYHCFQNVIQHSFNFVCFIVVAPLYFKHELNYGTVNQAHMIFMHLTRGLFDFTSQLDQISNVGAQSIRVVELWDTLDRYAAGPAEGVKSDDSDASTDAGDSSDDEETRKVAVLSDADDGDEDLFERIYVRDLPDNDRLRLQVTDLTLLPPVGFTPLIRDLNFSMGAGDSLLITGPSGTGKSTLLRTIGGLFSRGRGDVVRTTLDRTFFVPQNPYLFEGSLRSNVMYPSNAAEEDADVLQGVDDQIRTILMGLGVGYLVDRHGLEDDIDFDKMLSGGEKQRINFARVLLRKDLSFVLLDEATSALDDANEDVAYDLLRQSVTSYMSVGHRMNLKKYHTGQLVLERAPEGGCRGRVKPI